MYESLKENYGYLFEEALLNEIEECGISRSLSQGNILMDIGQQLTHMPLLLDGAIKILREDDDGNELLLYFLEKGDTCAMSFSCCLGTNQSEIRAVVESDVDLILVPVEKMEVWMAKYTTWRRFILDSYHGRMTELLETVDTIAFKRMDERLLKHLQDKAKVTHEVDIFTTHQDIAYDMHTSRVVISRLLKKLENQGKIEMHRNHIKILDL